MKKYQTKKSVEIKMYETAVFIEIWHFFVLFQIIMCTVKAYVLCRTVTMNSEDHTILRTRTTDHEPLQHLLSSAFQPLSTPTSIQSVSDSSSAHTISCEQILQLSQCKYYLNVTESWPQYSVQVSIFISGSNHFARCGSSPQTECILCISWDVLYISG